MRDINNQARSPSVQIGFEKFFREPEALCGQSSCFHQVVHGILHGLVVIDDGYQFGRAVHKHAARLTFLPDSQQSNFRLTRPDFRMLDSYSR
jgi:hypothetical protein